MIAIDRERTEDRRWSRAQSESEAGLLAPVFNFRLARCPGNKSQEFQRRQQPRGWLSDNGKVHISEPQELFAKPGSTKLDVARRRRIEKGPAIQQGLTERDPVTSRGGSLPNVSLGAADAGANVPLGHCQVCIVEAAEAGGDVVIVRSVGRRIVVGRIDRGKLSGA